MEYNLFHILARTAKHIVADSQGSPQWWWGPHTWSTGVAIIGRDHRDSEPLHVENRVVVCFLVLCTLFESIQSKSYLRSPWSRCYRLGILRQESTSNPNSQIWAHDEAWGKTVPMRCVTVQLTLYSFPLKLCKPWCFRRQRQLKWAC